MRTGLLCAAALLLSTTAVVAQMTKDPEVVKLADAYVKATLAGDAKAVAALYAEDAIEMPPNLSAIKGRAAIQQYYAKLFSNPALKLDTFTLNHIEAMTSGDVGYDVGTYVQTVTMKDKPVKETGKFTVILKRAGGEWQIAYAIYNADQSPAMP
jgi:uncharacterized protein (TIGR02246 family)